MDSTDSFDPKDVDRREKLYRQAVIAFHEAHKNDDICEKFTSDQLFMYRNGWQDGWVESKLNSQKQN